MKPEDERLRREGHLDSRGRLKDGFRDKAAAKRFLRRATGPLRKDDMQVYRCRACPNYHIGHKRPGGT